MGVRFLTLHLHMLSCAIMLRHEMSSSEPKKVWQPSCPHTEQDQAFQWFVSILTNHTDYIPDAVLDAGMQQ